MERYERIEKAKEQIELIVSHYEIADDLFLYHYLIGLALGGSNWDKGPSDSTLEALSALHSTLEEGHLLEVEDRYHDLIETGQKVPLWYLKYHAGKRFGHQGLKALNEILIPQVGRKVDPLGYNSDPLKSYPSSVLKTVASFMRKEKSEDRHCADRKDIEAMGIPGIIEEDESPNVSDEILSLIKTVRESKTMDFEESIAELRKWAKSFIQSVNGQSDFDEADQVKDFQDTLADSVESLTEDVQNGNVEDCYPIDLRNLSDEIRAAETVTLTLKLSDEKIVTYHFDVNDAD